MEIEISVLASLSSILLLLVKPGDMIGSKRIPPPTYGTNVIVVYGSLHRVFLLNILVSLANSISNRKTGYEQPVAAGSMKGLKDQINPV
jgi:hypothetical protein